MTDGEPTVDGAEQAGHLADEARTAAQIWATVLAIYEAYLAGDTAGIDRWIDDDATIWDSEQPPLVRGRAGLEVMRAARPPGAATAVTEISTESPVIDVWGDIAVVRHYLRIRFVDPNRPAQLVRNTGVWRRTGTGWRIVHNHEDLLPAVDGA